ncbi:hypothetical protein [Simkania sp.]|uniref:hypothetical protein n=1 Tax=Simkania sp. TaxID=34094 RepID=UPI003B529201
MLQPLQQLVCLRSAGLCEGASQFTSSTTQFHPLFQGFGGYAVATGVDRIARFFFLSGSERPVPNTLAKVLFSAVSEECLYSLLLPSETIYALPLRLIASFAVSSSATRALVGKPITNDQGLTTDTKVGLVWAMMHALILQTTPSEISMPVLSVVYIAIFALSEVAPANQGPLPPEVLTSAWNYKVISACFFRAIASYLKTYSDFAPFVQHALFNLHTYYYNPYRASS